MGEYMKQLEELWGELAEKQLGGQGQWVVGDGWLGERVLEKQLAGGWAKMMSVHVCAHAFLE